VEDPDIESELRARFGPDELALELEGPELVWMPQRHAGGCAYEFDYRVETPALYRLVAFSFRGKYESLQELQHPDYYFPPLHYDDLLGTAPPRRGAGGAAPLLWRVPFSQRLSRGAGGRPPRAVGTRGGPRAAKVTPGRPQASGRGLT